MSDRVKEFKNYQEFYPFYLSQHLNKLCRGFHFIGTGLVLAVLIYSLITAEYLLLLALPICGYFFAWLGHFIFEKNKPATFTYPLWSLIGDFHMFFSFLSGELPEQIKNAEKLINEHRSIT